MTLMFTYKKKKHLMPFWVRILHIKSLYIPIYPQEKPGANSRKVIVDLSCPHGASVNAGVDPDTYLGSEFLLTLPSVDYITNVL